MLVLTKCTLLAPDALLALTVNLKKKQELQIRHTFPPTPHIHTHPHTFTPTPTHSHSSHTPTHTTTRRIPHVSSVGITIHGLSEESITTVTIHDNASTVTKICYCESQTVRVTLAIPGQPRTISHAYSNATLSEYPQP